MTTYKIVRFHQNSDHQEVIKTGVTLEEAHEHCSDPETSSGTATSEQALDYTELFGPWFDAYVVEE